MCLITTQTEPFIAKEDMTVYKILRICKDKLKAAMHDYVYELDKLYETIVQTTDNKSTCDALDEQYLRENHSRWRFDSSFISYGPGFHSFSSMKRIKEGEWSIYSKEGVFECIIPVGSEYYTEPTGLIVSNKIIIKKKIEWNNLQS